MNKKWLLLLLLLGGSKKGSARQQLSALPLISATITSPFGFRYHPIKKDSEGKKAYKHHNGMDLAAPQGTPIFAAGDGVVLKAGWTNGGYGNKTEIDHGGGLVTKYGHQSKITVAPGEHVRAGQKIGEVGSTGMSTGNHLHFETWLNGKAVDPVKILPAIKAL